MTADSLLLARLAELPAEDRAFLAKVIRGQLILAEARKWVTVPDAPDDVRACAGLRACACGERPATLNRRNPETGTTRYVVFCTECDSLVEYRSLAVGVARQSAVDLWEAAAPVHPTGVS